MNPLVLVVDDEPDVEVLFRQQFRRDLRAGRFTMEFAQSAPMALQRITDAAGVSLILILSDINMPGMSGLELLPKAKALRPDVPIIMITAYGDAETKRKALENGAEALLTKPIDLGCSAAKSTCELNAPHDAGKAAMQQIADWLKQLGMSEYAERFVESDIDTSVLRDLTDQDLKELGVSLGHRRKMLRAIAELPGAAPTSPQPAFTEPKPQETAERRQVTVMFSDLVGSTALSARMDPEDLREVISAYQKCVAETVGRFGGFVAKFMGDGVLIYFGYPQAHEDDAERAVRAGLELVAAVSDLKTHAALQTRVGIATGLVVVGDLIGSGASQEQAIVGETPNLAARLQGVAEPNSVVIAESTRKLVGNLFELQDLGAQELKGIAGAVASMGCAATGFSRKPLRGFARERSDGTCRAGRRTRSAAAALVESKDRRRSSGAAVR